MLKFTIKLISDAGYQGEITSTSTAAHQPEVFSGLVRNALVEISALPLTEIKRHLKDFTYLVCVSQQMYFYSQVRVRVRVDEQICSLVPRLFLAA